jgi:hypothetical protein
LLRKEAMSVPLEPVPVRAEGKLVRRERTSVQSQATSAMLEGKAPSEEAKQEIMQRGFGSREKFVFG